MNERHSSEQDHGMHITRATPYAELPEYLSPDEFRIYVGIGRSAVYALLREGELDHVRFGRTIRIPKSALPIVSKVK
jgi:excisionase family DNA binding protein